MKTVVAKTVNMHIELSDVELIEAITEYVKQRTPRLTGRKKGGLLQMDNIRIKAYTISGDVLDVADSSAVSGDIERVNFYCEVK